MESWRKVWREGFAPLFSIKGLSFLYKALAEDDPRLIQGATTNPPALINFMNQPTDGGCAVAYCGIENEGGFGKASVTDVEEFFARACFEADNRLGEPAACRYFLNWFDDTPREEMRSKLTQEISMELDKRSTVSGNLSTNKKA